MSDKITGCEKCGHDGFTRNDRGLYRCMKCFSKLTQDNPPPFMVVRRWSQSGRAEVIEYKFSAEPIPLQPA